MERLAGLAVVEPIAEAADQERLGREMLEPMVQETTAVVVVAQERRHLTTAPAPVLEAQD
jgi:hypothetical protein